MPDPSLATILAAIQDGSGGDVQAPQPASDLSSIQGLTDYKPSQVRLDPESVSKIIGMGQETKPYPDQKPPVTKREKIIAALNKFSNNFLGQNPSWQQEFQQKKENTDWEKARAMGIMKYQQEQDQNQRDVAREDQFNRTMNMKDRAQQAKDKETDIKNQQFQANQDRLYAALAQQGAEANTRAGQAATNEADRNRREDRQYGLERDKFNYQKDKDAQKQAQGNANVTKVVENARQMDQMHESQVQILDEVQQHGSRSMLSGDPMLNGPQSMQFLANHISMTMGGVKGVKTGREIIQEHVKARDLDQSMQALAQKVLAGGVITYQQAQQMLGTTNTNRKAAWDHAMQSAQDANADISDRVPQEFGGRRGAPSATGKGNTGSPNEVEWNKLPH